MTTTPVPPRRSDRMKHYEHLYRHTLPPKAYTILRVDGRAFHTLTRNMERPFDGFFMQAMDAAAIALCEEVQGVAFGYLQSDEISLIATDFASMQEHWFGGVVQKMCSIAAVVASNAFNIRIPAIAARRMAEFDARVFTVPNRYEAINYFLWRQTDCYRNAVSMAAEAHFSSNQLKGKPATERLTMLASKGIDFMDYPEGARHGRVVIKIAETAPVTYTRKDTGLEHTEVVTRHRWEAQPAPWLYNSGFLETHIPHPPAPAEDS